uniref:Uncharacterized protein n=1 Tax=Populus davidiana TaxID=266767 RepID=A0A6M2EPR8_9ROSI
MLREMLSLNSEVSPADGALLLQSSRLLPLSSLPTHVALHRQQSESLLSSIQLKRSHEESVQEGIRFNLLFFGTVLVSSPFIQASDASDSSHLSPSPTLRNKSGAGIVSSSSCLDGYGVDYFTGTVMVSPPPTPALEGLDSSYPVSPSSLVADGPDGSGVVSIDGATFIFGDVFVVSSSTADTISGVLGLIAGVQGSGTSLPSALGLWTSTTALTLGLFPWVFPMIQGDGVGHLLPRFLSSVPL